MGKILQGSLELNFSPNTLGCYGLSSKVEFFTLCSFCRPQVEWNLSEVLGIQPNDLTHRSLGGAVGDQGRGHVIYVGFCV